jgi:uncharacterized protein YndB with AHSA1/START domain
MTLGRLENTAAGPQLRFTRRLAHPAHKVWRALTETEHLDAWFPQRIEGAWERGATLRFVDREGRGEPFDGRVVAVEPPRVLEFTWGTDTLRFELAADGDETVLTLLDTIDDIGKAARDGAGWHACLDLLETDLDGRPPASDAGEVWQQVHPKYVAEFGPEAATIGPPEGFEPDGD